MCGCDTVLKFHPFTTWGSFAVDRSVGQPATHSPVDVGLGDDTVGNRAALVLISWHPRKTDTSPLSFLGSIAMIKFISTIMEQTRVRRIGDAKG